MKEKNKTALNISREDQQLKSTNQVALLLVQYVPRIGPMTVLKYYTARCIFEDFLSL